MNNISKIFKQLSQEGHKGKNGKLCLFGGSLAYTGAPYFASMAFLKAGGDLATIVCYQNAAIPIKCYSPELIVFPLIDQLIDRNEEAFINFKSIIKNSTSLVFGPGIGRQNELDNMLPKQHLVIDADGLWILKDNFHVIKNKLNHNIIITPNIVEFHRFFDSFQEINSNKNQDQLELVKILSKYMNVRVLLKGEHDIISDGKQILQCDDQGSIKRPGGLGDILSGITSLFLNQDQSLDSILSACKVVKMATKKGEETYKLSMLASNVLDQLNDVLENLKKQ